MEGITVLNITEKIVETWGFSWPGLIFALFCALLIAIIATRTEPNAIGFLFILLLICTVISLAFFGTAKVDYIYNEYEVLLDNGIDFKEFYDTYEIKDHRGDIYTIVLKEDLNQ